MDLSRHAFAASPEFQKNRDRMTQLVAELKRERTGQAGRRREATCERHRSQGKLPVRERIRRAPRPGSPLLELSAAGGVGHVRRRGAGAGVVTGIGRVSGREVLIVATTPRSRAGPTTRSRSRSTCVRSRSRSKTGCPASTWSTPAARSCRCRQRSSRTRTTSAGSSSTRRGCPEAIRRLPL
jgi:acetyl-CoA carboxylase carboxyltransferase component